MRLSRLTCCINFGWGRKARTRLSSEDWPRGYKLAKVHHLLPLNWNRNDFDREWHVTPKAVASETIDMGSET